ncbi:hypothetical protein [Streptomyces antarcticus]|uniref:hypothetical protein n=1 Tax=Streptomyces antarcticus TaxID=2996458 RepID=UPI00226FC442|nr:MULTISPECIES: hypothetical protein [unclassified Streptomyces]MCY0942423.1 hypothetical protein [Streptomyces sp. H34-AA3]MCZ4080580.1 hypothetical protein [Streptomyces sp. H34-S5]
MRTGTLTLNHEVDVAAYHSLPILPTWHPCNKHHGHDYRITMELTAPAGLVTDDAADQLRVAAAELARPGGPLHMEDLGYLDGGEFDPRADSQWLAAWVHRWVAARLPEALSTYLVIQVQAPAVDRIPMVHRGSAIPVEHNGQPV